MLALQNCLFVIYFMLFTVKATLGVVMSGCIPGRQVHRYMCDEAL